MTTVPGSIPNIILDAVCKKELLFLKRCLWETKISNSLSAGIKQHLSSENCLQSENTFYHVIWNSTRPELTEHNKLFSENKTKKKLEKLCVNWIEYNSLVDCAGWRFKITSIRLINSFFGIRRGNP